MAEMTEAERKLLFDLALQARALRDAVVMLLAMHARASDDTAAVIREFASGLDDRLSSLRAIDPGQVPYIEQVRREYDWIVEAARLYLGEIDPSGPSDPKT
jgi:predicted metal-dependent HD superfamily phosphohydrolase